MAALMTLVEALKEELSTRSEHFQGLVAAVVATGVAARQVQVVLQREVESIQEQLEERRSKVGER